MHVIRRNVFETNSSSSHSVSYHVKPDNEILDLNKIKDKYSSYEVVVVSCGEYGWGYDLLCSFEEKLAYVLTSIQYNSSESVDNMQELQESEYFKWLNEIVTEYCGVPIGIFGTDIGHVDHQSTDTLRHYFVEDKEKFRSRMIPLLFDDDYTIIIDNDNH